MKKISDLLFKVFYFCAAFASKPRLYYVSSNDFLRVFKWAPRLEDEWTPRMYCCHSLSFLMNWLGIICHRYDQFGFKNVILLHLQYLGVIQEQNRRWVFESMHCFSPGTAVHLGHCIIFCNAVVTPLRKAASYEPRIAILGIWGDTWLTRGKYGIYGAVRGSYGALAGSTWRLLEILPCEISTFYCHVSCVMVTRIPSLVLRNTWHYVIIRRQKCWFPKFVLRCSYEAALRKGVTTALCSWIAPMYMMGDAVQYSEKTIDLQNHLYGYLRHCISWLVRPQASWMRDLTISQTHYLADCFLKVKFHINLLTSDTWDTLSWYVWRMPYTKINHI